MKTANSPSAVENSGLIFLRWLRIFAFTCLSISLIALSLALYQSAHAQDENEPEGFQNGRESFQNPFADQKPVEAPQAPPPTQREEEDEPYSEDDSREIEAERESDRPSFPASRGGGTNFEKDVPEPQKGPEGYVVGGEPPGGVISNQKRDLIELDDVSAVGGSEIVTDFNFPDAEIMDIARTMGKLTGKNFILDKNVKGRITLISNSPITVADAWKAFLTSLDINGFTIIPSGKYLRIARHRDARDKQLNTYTGNYSPDTDALITRVIPLRYITADEVARSFRSFMPTTARIIPYDQTNTIIVTDTGSNIQKLAKMLEILDVEGYDAGIEVISVKFASAAELAKLIDTLIPGTATDNKNARARARGSDFAARKTKEGGIINTIIADDRTNSLIVHANGKGAEEVRSLVQKLDKKMPDSARGGKIHVVYLQFADAEQLSQTLNNFSANQGASRASGTKGVGTNPIEGLLFEGNIKVSPDKSTNSLVITASPSDFEVVQRVINQLDIPRDQVYVEIVVMEMTLGREFNFSANVVMPNSGVFLAPKGEDLLGFLTAPFTQKGVILGFGGGGTSTFTIAGEEQEVNNIQGLIKAIQSNSQSNVLATPQILTLDNKEATFETSENIPVPTTNATQGTVTQGITKEKVALSVTIKPQINKISNFVKLDIKTTLADISNRPPPADLAGRAFVTFERRAETSVVVADSDTVVLGGLVRDKTADSVSKVPVLGDIPLLGWLFRATQTESVKTNLLIFITPQIIRQYEKIRTVLDQKLKERDEFIERSAGGQDPHREQRNEMIRKIPDRNDLSSYQSTSSLNRREGYVREQQERREENPR